MSIGSRSHTGVALSKNILELLCLSVEWNSQQRPVSAVEELSVYSRLPGKLASQCVGHSKCPVKVTSGSRCGSAMLRGCPDAWTSLCDHG